jgi:hypothetical protein
MVLLRLSIRKLYLVFNYYVWSSGHQNLFTCTPFAAAAAAATTTTTTATTTTTTTTTTTLLLYETGIKCRSEISTGFNGMMPLIQCSIKYSPIS